MCQPKVLDFRVICCGPSLLWSFVCTWWELSLRSSLQLPMSWFPVVQQTPLYSEWLWPTDGKNYECCSVILLSVFCNHEIETKTIIVGLYVSQPSHTTSHTSFPVCGPKCKLCHCLSTQWAAFLSRNNDQWKVIEPQFLSRLLNDRKASIVSLHCFLLLAAFWALAL